MKIGILGGTFDPVHRGHLALARAAADQFALDKVLFIPAFIPPHKAGRRDLTPAPYRYRMVELAIRPESQFEVSDIEFSRPDLSYTVDTLRGLKEHYPASEFFLILGADSLAEFSNWQEPDQILGMARILCAARPGVREPEDAPAHEPIKMPECPIASSQIREKVFRGEPVRDLLPEGVWDYIERMKLYAGRDA